MSLDACFTTARDIAKVVGPIPWSFASCIRLLMNGADSASSSYSPEAFYQLKRMLKSPTVMAALYHFIRSFRPEKFDNGQVHGPISLARMLDPVSMSALLAIMYLYKRTQRLCNKDEWLQFGPRFQRQTEMAVEIGQAFGDIGSGYALLAEGVLHAALATFMASDKKGFTEYRRLLKKERIRFNPAYEMKRWGCTSVQIASLLIVALGFGNDLALAFEHGFSENIPPAEEKESLRFFKYNLVSHAMLVPSERTTSRLFKENSYQEAFSALIPIATALTDEINLSQWLEKSKNDFSLSDMPGFSLEEVAGGTHKKAEPTAAPQPTKIQEAPQPGKTTSIEGPDCDVKSHYEDLPEDVRTQLSPEEFKQLEYLTLEEIIQLFR